MHTPLVSVVVPTYNRAYCIEKTINSVLAQTYPNIEILIIDDGSTDDTGALIERLYGRNPQVQYIYQKNQGVSSARNHGMRIAKGEYIALLDSDDIWEPWKTEMQVAVLNRLPQVGMVWTNMVAVDPEGSIISPAYLRTMYGAYENYPTSQDLFEDSIPIESIAPHLAGIAQKKNVYFGDIFSSMILGNLVHTSTVLMRRDRMEKTAGFREEYRFAGEDYDYHLRTCREGKVAYIDVSSIIYQCGMADQITEKYKLEFETSYLFTIKPFLKNDRDRIHISQSKLNGVLAMVHASIGEHLIARGDRWGALKHFLSSLAYRPLSPRVFAFSLFSMLPHFIYKWARHPYRLMKHSTIARVMLKIFTT